MNFLTGDIMGGRYLSVGGQRLKLPERMGEVVAKNFGKTLVLGIRPESFSPGQSGKYSGEENFVTGKVHLIEPLGDKMDIRLEADGIGDLLCRADAYEFGKMRVGDVASFYVDMNRVHLFEQGDEGTNLTVTAAIG
jgi:multiple sugar transport system ATP-binding protein